MINISNLRLEYEVRVKTGFLRSRKERCEALGDLSFAVAPGELVGYLGGNGAGKSSTIKVICGILRPSSGTALIDGLEPYASDRERRTVARRLGVVFGQRSQLLWELPVRDSFRLLRSVYDVDPVLHVHNMKAFERFLELSPLLDKPVRQLSLGQRMRCEVAAAFLHDPALVLLDEPTIGLDAHVKDRLRQFIAWTNREKGTTILLTSHDLGDIETLCRRIILLEKGNIAFDGDLEALTRRSGFGRQIIFVLATPLAETPTLRGNVVRVELFAGGSRLVVACGQGADVKDLITQVLELADVRDMETMSPSIEDALKRFYAGELPDATFVRGTAAR